MDQKDTSSWYSVFFTSPKIPFDQITTGGIEENLIALINNANISIDVSVFEFNLENVAQSLIRAHLRGVLVRVVYDSQFAGLDPQIASIIASGILAVGDNRSSFMHNKFFIIDKQSVWTGSFNITINSAYKNNENAIVIHDRFLAKNYTLEFEEMLAGKFGRRSPKNTIDVLNIHGIRVENYFAPEQEVMNLISSLAAKATSYIHFLAFSFTDPRLSDIFKIGLDRGIKIAGVFEERGSQSASSKYISLKQCGAEVRVDGNPYIMHHKIIIIDGRLVIFGSYNFSSNAARVNDENLLIIYDPFLVGQYEAEFQKIFAQAK